MVRKECCPPCWSQSDALAILATEALEVSDAAFLATHLPINDFEVTGSHGSEVDIISERGLLDVLSNDERRHAFCLVEGEPGSGKSHLVRWLGAKWNTNRDLKLIIQRADGSLEGTLDQLSKKLPETYRHLFASLGRRQEMTLEGRARSFVAQLAVATRIESFTEELPHSTWCDQHQVDRLLSSQTLQDNWNGPVRILKILSGQDGHRSSKLASFNLKDIAQIAALEHQISKEVGTKTLRLLRALKTESEKAIGFLNQGYTERQIAEKFPNDIRDSQILVEVLNTRLNHAIQHLLGISAQGLREMFLSLRRALRKDDRRLVLLLEDITNFQGVDSQLIDVLVTQSKTREDQDLCDLISVVGITPAYRKEHLQANYLNRVTHHILLGREQHGGHQDVANLRTPESQIAFAAKYLRATRAGIEALEKWGGSELDPVPNRCSTCIRKKSCHESFGEVDGVGLFPFTKSAITGMFGSLEDPEGRSNPQTPRGLIQSILNPTMLRPEFLQDSDFPSVHLEMVRWLPEAKRRLSGGDHQFLAAQIQDESTRQRVARLVALWGNNSALRTTTTSDGELLFAGISRGVYESFGLPWLGSQDSVAAVGDDIDSAGPVRENEVVGPKTPRLLTGPSKPQRAKEELRDLIAPKVVVTSQKPVQVKPSEIQLRLAQLRAWRDGKLLEPAQFWNELAYDLVCEIDWETIDINPWIKDKFFTKNLIKIQGTGATTAIHFVLPDEDWLKNGLESCILLRNRESTYPELDRRRVAQMLLRIRRLVSSRASQVIPKNGDKFWPVAKNLTQLLAATDWLLGAYSPKLKLVEQWSKLLSTDAIKDHSDRTSSWKRCVEALRPSRSKFSEMIRNWTLVTRQKDGVTFLAAAEVYAALEHLQQTMEFSETPPSIPTQNQWAELSLVASKTTEIRSDFLKCAKAESKRILEECDEFEQILRGKSIRAHLHRVQTVCSRVGDLLLVNSDHVQQWMQRYEKLRTEGRLDDTVLERFTSFLNTATEEGRTTYDTQKPVFALAWAQKAPINDLRRFLEVLRAGEAAVEKLHHEIKMQSAVGASGESNTLDKVHSFSRRLQQVSNSLQDSLKGRTN